MEDLDAETIAYAHRMFDLARAGDTAELAAQVDAGLPADLTSATGDTLLILAAYYRHGDTVAALLERGADPERVNDRGQTALAAAVFRQDPETVRMLLRAGADPRSGMATAEFFKLPEMVELLGRRADDAPASEGGLQP